jgi:hypothetical protein
MRSYLGIVFIMAATQAYATQISNPQINNDNTNIYFSFTAAQPYTYYQVFIDSDLNPAT